MEPVSLLAVLGVLLGGMVLKVIEEAMYSRKEKAADRALMERPPDNIILPPSIQKAEDFVWFQTVLKMAGMENVEVVNTCDCGFATECYMHCNHDLSDKCTGHAYTPWTGKFKAVQTPDLISVNDRRANDMRAIATQHRERTLPDSKVDAFRQKMIDNRNAKLKAEFEATKKVRGPAFDEMEALRKVIDERERKLKKIEDRLDRLNKALTPPKPQYITQPTTYDPVLDCFTVYGKKISRHMLEDLIYNGGLTRDQLREVLASPMEYETVYGDDVPCYNVRVR